MYLFRLSFHQNNQIKNPSYFFLPVILFFSKFIQDKYSGCNQQDAAYIAGAVYDRSPVLSAVVGILIANTQKQKYVFLIFSNVYYNPPIQNCWTSSPLIPCSLQDVLLSELNCGR